MKVNPENYRKGSIVVCILNNRATLTVGKEYTIISNYVYADEVTIYITNDDGDEYEYDALRFIPKSDFRHHLINQILD